MIIKHMLERRACPQHFAWSTGRTSISSSDANSFHEEACAGVLGETSDLLQGLPCLFRHQALLLCWTELPRHQRFKAHVCSSLKLRLASLASPPCPYIRYARGAAADAQNDALSPIHLLPSHIEVANSFDFSRLQEHYSAHSHATLPFLQR